MENVKKNRLIMINFIGLFGVFLWVFTIFLRETSLVQDSRINFLLGITPNFGVALLIPMLLINYFPIVFKKAITHRNFLCGMGIIFTTLFFSEVVHDLFLNSPLDIWDLVASSVAIIIMALISGKKFS